MEIETLMTPGLEVGEVGVGEVGAGGKLEGSSVCPSLSRRRAVKVSLTARVRGHHMDL